MGEVLGTLSVRVALIRTLSDLVKLSGNHLADFCVQPLAHFCAAVVNHDAAIGIDMQQCPCLIKMLGGERDTELDRSQCEPFLITGLAAL